MVHIICFGASVTQQDLSHATGEMTGYVPYLGLLVRRNITHSTLSVIAAGSSHFDDAGYALLPEALSRKPDLVILDWHSTGLAEFNDILWHSAICKLIESRIPTLIAIFPRRDVIRKGTMRPNFYQALDVVGSRISVVNGYEFIGLNPEQHLRDDVHTTPLGGQLYAENLIPEVLKILRSNKESGNADSQSYSTEYMDGVLRPSVDKYVIHESDYVEIRSIDIAIESDKSLLRPYLVMDLVVGPSSPVLQVSVAGHDDQFVSLWDPWCHYRRQTYKKIVFPAKQSGPTKALITVSDRTPEYSLCKKAGFAYIQSAHGRRCIEIKAVYAIGGIVSEVTLEG